MPKKSSKSLQITQVKSGIGHRQKAKRTLRALGLRKLHQTVVHSDTPVIRGMVNSVAFLVRVEEV